MNTFSKKNFLVLIIALVVIFVGFGTARIVAHRVIRSNVMRTNQNALQDKRPFNNPGDSSGAGPNFRMPRQDGRGLLNRSFTPQRRMFGMMMYGPRYFFRQFHGQLIRNPAFLASLAFGMLGIFTLGILALVLIAKVAKKVNVFCEGDGRQTGTIGKFIVLSFLTCGIYSLLWLYMLGDRMQENAPRYNLNFKESGAVILLWHTIGILVLAGPLVALYIIIKNTDKLEAAYNKTTNVGQLTVNS